MKVYTQATIEVAGHDVPKGTFIDIPETLIPSIAGKVAYLADGKFRTPGMLMIWRLSLSG